LIRIKIVNTSLQLRVFGQLCATSSCCYVIVSIASGMWIHYAMHKASKTSSM
jgi:uncharacterized membrane protein YuzA (DUF378 family)